MYMTNPYIFGFDPDAEAFFTATGITDATIKGAINTFVLSLKNNSIWTKMKAIYPFVGGTATTHKYNLKDPQDTDGAFRLTFASAVTHGSNGITASTANGANNIVDTKLNPSTAFSDNDFSAGCLNHTAPNVDNAPGGSFFGVVATGSTNWPRFTRTNSTSWTCGFGGNSRTNTVTALTQFLSVTNTAATNIAQPYLDGSSIGLTISTSTGSRPNATLYLLRFNANGTVNGTCAFTMKFAFIGVLLTSTEMGNLYTAVTQLQTNLGR